jgi:hypothetical protein
MHVTGILHEPIGDATEQASMGLTLAYCPNW